MAQENVIKKKVKEELARDGWVSWTGAKAMYQSSDIFGIFDLIAAKMGANNQLRFIQYTSFANMGARRRKMRLFFEANRLFIKSELWGYEGGEFKKEYFRAPEDVGITR